MGNVRKGETGVKSWKLAREMVGVERGVGGGSRRRMRRITLQRKTQVKALSLAVTVSKRDNSITICLVSHAIPETSIFDALKISKLGLDYGREPPIILMRFLNIVSICCRFWNHEHSFIHSATFIVHLL